MSNKPRQQLLRTLASRGKKKLKRGKIQKHKRHLTFLDKKFPKCEHCNQRNRWDVKCPNHDIVLESEQEKTDVLRVQEVGGQ